MSEPQNEPESTAGEEAAAPAPERRGVPQRPRPHPRAPSRAVVGNDVVGFLLWQWEKRHLKPWQFRLALWWREHVGGVRLAALLLSTFVLGALLASTPEMELRNLQLREQVARHERELKARQGELELTRLELARVNRIMQYSGTHDVPADLASTIYDIAVAEGIDPKIGFGLVSVESEFFHRAISSKGAVGLTQVMPSTAKWLQPDISYQQLFNPETNLRLGFRYLRMLINQYDGDVRLALLAYNRGPGTVDGLLIRGQDPGNGYARAVNKQAQRTD